MVNIGAFTLLDHLTGNATLYMILNNAIANILAILFAYITNRKWVFESFAVTRRQKLKEMAKFFLSRGFTLVIDFAGLFLMHKVFGVNEIISKIVVSIVVIVLNFVFSKLIIFTKPNDLR